MQGLNISNILMFLVSAILQIVGLSLLPLTQGFNRILPSVSVSICYIVAIGLLGKLVHAGVNLSILMPFLAAAVPLSLIAVGVLVYGEPASYAKLGVLIVASGLIGYASTL